MGSNKKPKLDFSDTVPGSRMSDRLSALPDEIICGILPSLTLRESVRTRLLSARWRYLSDYRCALHFDTLNVLGKRIVSEYYCLSNQSKFVTAVEQYLNTWKGSKLSALKVDFCLENKQASHINKWVESGISMEIEDLELCCVSPGLSDDTYVFPDHLLHSGKALYLKCLRLIFCALKFPSKCTSWISQLATLELTYVRLHQKDLDCLMSSGLKLVSLSLVFCCTSSSVSVEHPRLKNLFFNDDIKEIELSCPNLETFGCKGRVHQFQFSNVPLLTKVNMSLPFHRRGGSLAFDDLATHAPKLQTLSLLLMVEVERPPPAITMSQLKRLELLAEVPTGFDLFNIMPLLNSCPLLEILHLQLRERNFAKQFPQRLYSDCQHLKLKEVIIDGFRLWLNEMELARYLLKNAVALEQMVIVDLCDCRPQVYGTDASYCSARRERIKTDLLRHLNTSAKLVITTPIPSRVLNDLDMKNYGAPFCCRECVSC